MWIHCTHRRFAAILWCLVVFGMQATQTDQVLCAVSTALALRRRLGEPPHAVVASHPMTYAVCLGLHTGSVAVESPSGETPNLATWLQYHAVPDTIFASGRRCGWFIAGRGS